MGSQRVKHHLVTEQQSFFIFTTPEIVLEENITSVKIILEIPDRLK